LDAFITKLAPSGNSLVYSTYLGGSSSDHAYALAVDTAGVYVAGDTNSTDFPTASAYQGSNAGGWDAFVAFLADKLTLLAPNGGGDPLATGSNYEIRWAAPPEATFKLLYSLDNGATWKLIEKGITGSNKTWVVPPITKNSKKCLVKVIGYDNKGTKIGADKSDGLFMIEVLKLTYPDGGESFLPGSDITITWTTHVTIWPVDQVILSYSLDNGVTWKKFANQPPDNSGSYQVTLPTPTKAKSKCKVKVVLKDDKGRKVGSDTSDGVFTISP
jgi:hypothetical protein